MNFDPKISPGEGSFKKHVQVVLKAEMVFEFEAPVELTIDLLAPKMIKMYVLKHVIE